MWLARLVEYGFLLPLEPAGPERTVDGHSRLLRLACIDHQMQFCRVSLTSSKRVAATEREVFVVLAHHPELSDEAVAALAATLVIQLPHPMLLFLRKDHPGRASATCVGEPFGELAAAAVATIKTVAGWDDCNPIDVRVDEHDFEVVMVRSENQWFARVASRAA